jgi:hypothetical protein
MSISAIFILLALISWALDAFRVPIAINLFSLGWAFIAAAWLVGAGVGLHG